jgi:arabinofuranosyltransferase
MYTPRLGIRTWRWLPVAILVVECSLLLLHAQVYSRFVSDDALISLRYARRCVEGHGFTWTGTERVEGYTDFLWVLLNAAGGWLHLDYLTTALTLDRLGVVLALAIVGLSPGTGLLSAARLIVGGSLLASSVPIAVWANGGLEHGFVTGVLAASLFLVERRMVTSSSGRGVGWLVGVPFAVLALLRADGILLSAFVLGTAVLVEWIGGTPGTICRWLPGVVPPAIAVTAQLAFRRFYYGTWQPNTALAKLAFNRDRLLGGLDYLNRGYHAIGVLVIVAMVATVLLWRRGERSRLVLHWTLIVGWSTYLAIVGGDIFPGWRQLVFVLVPLCFVAAELGERLADQMLRKGLRLLLAAAVVATAGIAVAHVFVQRTDSENARAKAELWEWNGFWIGTLLKEAFGRQQPLLAVDAAGALPYWSELPSLDMLGLNDAYIARHPPPTYGHGEIGHELGDGAYVLRRHPDLIAFNNASGDRQPKFLSGRQLVVMPEFVQSYQWIRIEPSARNGVSGEIWVRREGGRIGIIRKSDAIEVPGYFLTGQESDAVASPDSQTNEIVVALSDPRYGVLPNIDVPAGRWRIAIDPPDAAGRTLGVRCEGRSMDGAPTQGDQVIELEQTRGIGIAVAPRFGTSQSTLVRRVLFLREPVASSTDLHCAAPGMPVTVAPQSVSTVKAEHLPWSHPTNVLIGLEGLVVRVVEPGLVHRIDLSADNDDTYAVEIRRGERRWRTEVGPQHNGAGLAVYRVFVAESIAVMPGDEIAVIPIAGDGHYVVGHVSFE